MLERHAQPRVASVKCCAEKYKMAQSEMFSTRTVYSSFKLFIYIAWHEIICLFWQLSTHKTLKSPNINSVAFSCSCEAIAE